jgi:hypothetical protein
VIEARPPREGDLVTCTGCGGAKGAPIAAVVTLGPHAQLHPALKIARDASALGREEESEQIIHEFNESGESALVDQSVRIVLCEECGRDAANAIGFMCVRDGGWSKLEPRRSALKRTGQKTLKKLQRSAR